jgi:Tol biopolymer transport system component
MMRSLDLDRALTAWLSDGSTQRMPAGLIERVVIDTRNRPQQPAWLVAVRRESMGSALQLSARTRRLTLIVVIALLAAVAIALIAGRQPPKPLRAGLLAFVRGGDVFLSNVDGSDMRIALHQDGVVFLTVAWSTTGNWLAVDGETGVVLVDAGTGVTAFVGGHDPIWSPDGGLLAVMTDDGLRILDPATRTTRAQFPFGAVGGLAWSPNGRWIAATGNCTGPRCPVGETSASNAVIRIDVSTGEVMELDPRSGHLDAERQVAWSPDSRRIAYIRWGIEKLPRGTCSDALSCSTDVMVADADGQNASRLNREPGQADRPAWSADGNWVSYRNFYRAAGVSLGITIEHPDGTGERSLVTMPATAYVWGPESDRLWFTLPGTIPATAAVWEATLDGNPQPRGLTVDHGLVTYQLTGLGFQQQLLALGASAPPLPNQSLATPEPTLTLVPPPSASPADSRQWWATLLAQSDDGCKLMRVAIGSGSVTSVAELCNPQPAETTALSPTGSGYAVIRDGRLSIVRADGHIQPDVDDLTVLQSVAWSPDGTWLSVTGEKSYLLRLDGTGLRAIAGDPSWSPRDGVMAIPRPDGSLLIGSATGAFTSIGSFPGPVTWSPDGSRFGFIRDGDLWTAAIDGTDVHNVTTLPLGGAVWASWSPDGLWISVTGNHGLWLVRPDGSERRSLAFGVDEFVSAALWSPDSSRVAIDAYGQGSPTGQANFIYLVSIDGTPTIRLDRATGPSWSPDGRFLVATETTASAGGFDPGSLVLMNADGSGRRPIRTAGSVQTPIVWLR